MNTFTGDEFKGGDAEMARRLPSLRQEPSPALITRIRTIPTSPSRRVRGVRRWAWGLTAVVLLAVALLWAAPLRAAVVEIQRIIGNVYLSIAERSPDSRGAQIVEPALMSLAEARAAVPFSFGIPSYLPAGWQMEAQVRVGDLGGGPVVQILYHGGGFFSAREAQQEGGTPISWLVGPGSFRQVEINGQPAVLIQGGWDADSRRWAWPEVITLIWTVDGVQYALTADSKQTSEAEMIAIAASVQPPGP